MTLRLADSWVWDFWFAVDGEDVHVFFLHAPRSLGDPQLRHDHARIGHAVSRDLRTWTVLPPVLPEAPAGAPDDLAQWTGSVVRDHDGCWHLFYTGRSTVDGGDGQRVLSATSSDLLDWRRTDVLVEAHPRWYEKAGPGAEEHWRDPYVVWDEQTDRWHLLITARVHSGRSDERGSVAHATSADLRRWTVHEPLYGPGDFRQLEVTQLVHLGGTWRILFSASVIDHSAARLARTGHPPVGGTHFLVGAERFGPYRLDRDEFLVGDPGSRHYAGRLLEHGGRWWFFAWLENDAEGRFLGELSDPMPVSVSPDGDIGVDVSPRLAAGDVG